MENVTFVPEHMVLLTALLVIVAAGTTLEFTVNTNLFVFTVFGPAHESLLVTIQ